MKPRLGRGQRRRATLRMVINRVLVSSLPPTSESVDHSLGGRSGVPVPRRDEPQDGTQARRYMSGAWDLVGMTSSARARGNEEFTMQLEHIEGTLPPRSCSGKRVE